MSQLYVFYKNDLVGTLTKKEDATLGFQYTEQWIKGELSFPLSPILSLDNGREFNHRESLAFFENLIPEGDVKDILQKLIGKSLDTGYQFLQEFGVDCAGAFVISSDENMPETVVANEFEKIDIAELSRAHQDNENLMAHVMKNHKGKFSLAGAQDKIPVVLYENELFVPSKGAPTTHILKPPHLSKSVKDSVYNEYFCMKLARACGLDVANAEIFQAEVPFYITERYDRGNTSEGIERLHQIDFCQTQNRLVSEKYESDGGPTLKDNYEAIQKYSSNTIEDTNKFIEWFCFNLVIGNNDCHSKNISFLKIGKDLRVSPFYDLLCTSIYKDYILNFAFKVGGNNYWGQLANSHFEEEAVRWGFTKNSDIILLGLFKMIDNIERVLDGELAEFEEKFPNIKVANRIKTEIEKRVKSFLKRLS